jgi:hypothetical protein
MAKLKSYKKLIAVVLAFAICLSICILSSVITGASAEEPINVVYSDDFSSESLNGDWVYMAKGTTTDDGKAYTSEIENGLLKVNTHKLGRSSIAGCLYLPGKETVNQRVAVETSSLQNGDTICVYARLNKGDDSNWKSLKGYYARYCTSNGKIQLFKINTASSNVVLIDSGYRGYTAGEKYRLEIIVSGTERTVISVRLIKVTDTLEQVVAQNTYVDTNSPFTSGTAGIGVAGSSSSSSQYAYLDNFEYTSTDNVKDTPKYLSHLRSVGTKTFGQVVTLDKGAEYVFAAYGTVDSKDAIGYRNEPLWVEYQTGANQYSSSTQRLIINRSAICKTADLTKAQCKQNNLPYSEYNVSYVTFTAGKGDTEGLADSYIGGKVKHVVGIRVDTSTHLLGNYSYFMLYRKDDPYRTNLLVNPEFKMGLYGWSDTAGSYFGCTQGKETNALSTAKGYVSILSDKNNYEYYEAFKNPNYNGIDGDANRDDEFNVCDLVYSNITNNKYYYIADYNKDGNINSLDGDVIKLKLASIVKESKPEVIGLDNDSVDDDFFR